MVNYILAFCLSLVGTYFANGVKNKALFLLCRCFAVLPTILLAGLRARTVGFDLDYYVWDTFIDAVNSKNDLDGFLERRFMFEKGYVYLNVLSAHISNSPIVFLSLLHTVIILPVYVAAMRLKKVASPVLVMFVYYCVCYNESLCFVRQAAAMSITFCAFTFFLEKKYYTFLSLMILGFFFHSTAVIALLFPVCFWIAKKYPIKDNIKKYVFICLVGIVVFTCFEPILVLLVKMSIIPSKFLLYTQMEHAFSGKLGLSNFFVKILTILLLLIIRKRYNPTPILDFFLLIAFFDLMFSALGIFVSHLIRLSLYPRIMSCFTLAYVLKRYNISVRNNGMTVVSFKLLMSILILFFWYRVYIFGDYAATAQFKFNPSISNSVW